MSADDIFNAAVAIARDVVDERSEGMRLRTILVGKGSERIKFAVDYNDLHEHEREWHDRVASEFAAPYLARIAKLESQVAPCRSMLVSIVAWADGRAISQEAADKVPLDRWLGEAGMRGQECFRLRCELDSATNRITKLEAENKSLRDACTCRARERSATIAALEDEFREGRSTELLSQVKP